MDLNRLYSDHQLLLLRAERAPTEDLRERHEIAASPLAGRIGCMQRAMGADGARVWDALALAQRGSLASPARHLQGYAA